MRKTCRHRYVEYVTLHQLPLNMRGGRQSGSMHSQNVIMGGHKNSLLQGKEYTTSLPRRPTWSLALSPAHHSSTVHAGRTAKERRPCDCQEDAVGNIHVSHMYSFGQKHCEDRASITLRRVVLL